VGLAEHQRVLARPELHGALEVCLVDLALRRRALELEALGIDGATRAAPSDADHPRKTHVDEQRGLRIVRQQPLEMDRALASPLDEMDLLRAGQLLVAREPEQRIAKRSSVERRDADGIVALHPLLGPELEADGRVAARLPDPSIESEQLF